MNLRLAHFFPRYFAPGPTCTLTKAGVLLCRIHILNVLGYTQMVPSECAKDGYKILL
jgi:hypothetical protein